jgi:hypothetical protein
MGKLTKGSDGKYLVDGVKYEKLVGSRAQVFHGTAYKTSSSAVKPKGDALTKKDLVQNNNGRIVSALKQRQSKKERRLEKHGFFAQKGKFGYVRHSPRRSSRSRSLSKSKSLRKTSRRPHTRGGRTLRRHR